MINREQFINEIAEVVNRNSMEKAFNDTPDFILARPGMFGNKGNERGNGIHQPPWNATLFSLLKWEIRKRYRTIGIKAPETKPGFCRLCT